MLAKQISDYCNESFFRILQTPVMEIVGLTALINAESIYNGKQS